MVYLIAITAVAGILAIALLLAIRANGPLVLDTVDRITDSSRDVALLEQAQFGKDKAQKLEVFGASAPAESSLPVFVFIHGGSWKSGDPSDYSFVARALAPEGFIVVNAGYRLHPEAIYPAMLEDTAGAIAWTHRNIARLGGDPNRIILAGHSAGAYNVAMTALDERWLAAEGVDADVIAGVVGLAGPYDFHPFTSESTRDSFGHVEEPTTTQPVSFAEFGGPPMLLLHGEADDVVKPRNSHALAKGLVAAGAAVETRFYAELNHNDLIIALASPWRSRRPILGEMVNFARSLQASVPVQDETR